MMKNSKNWNALDKFLARWRYQKVNFFVPKNGVVVDVGCGREAAFLKQNHKKIQKGIGFDFRIQNAVFENLELFHHEKDAPLNLKKESVDAVFLNAVLEHIPNPLPRFGGMQKQFKAQRHFGDDHAHAQK